MLSLIIDFSNNYNKFVFSRNAHRFTYLVVRWYIMLPPLKIHPTPTIDKRTLLETNASTLPALLTPLPSGVHTTTVLRLPRVLRVQREKWRRVEYYCCYYYYFFITHFCGALSEPGDCTGKWSKRVPCRQKTLLQLAGKGREDEKSVV